MTPHQTWTTTKPTKPGDYELSIEPTKRGSGSLAVRRVNVAWDGKHWLVYSGGGVARLADDYYQGALWREYVEPADPFEHPVSVTQIELPHERGYLRIEDNGDSVKATIWPDNAGGLATDRLRWLQAAALSAGEWLNRLCDKS